MIQSATAAMNIGDEQNNLEGAGGRGQGAGGREQGAGKELRSGGHRIIYGYSQDEPDKQQRAISHHQSHRPVLSLIGRTLSEHNLHRRVQTHL